MPADENTQMSQIKDSDDLQIMQEDSNSCEAFVIRSSNNQESGGPMDVVEEERFQSSESGTGTPSFPSFTPSQISSDSQDLLFSQNGVSQDARAVPLPQTGISGTYLTKELMHELFETIYLPRLDAMNSSISDCFAILQKLWIASQERQIMTSNSLSAISERRDSVATQLADLQSCTRIMTQDLGCVKAAMSSINGHSKKSMLAVEGSESTLLAAVQANHRDLVQIMKLLYDNEASQAKASSYQPPAGVYQTLRIQMDEVLLVCSSIRETMSRLTESDLQLAMSKGNEEILASQMKLQDICRDLLINAPPSKGPMENNLPSTPSGRSSGSGTRQSQRSSKTANNAEDSFSSPKSSKRLRTGATQELAANGYLPERFNEQFTFYCLHGLGSLEKEITRCSYGTNFWSLLKSHKITFGSHRYNPPVCKGLTCKKLTPEKPNGKCNSTMTTGSNLNRHFRTIPHRDDVRIGNLTCFPCGLQVNSEDELWSHLQGSTACLTAKPEANSLVSHEGPEPEVSYDTCITCGKDFKSPKLLMMHVKLCDGN